MVFYTRHYGIDIYIPMDLKEFDNYSPSSKEIEKSVFQIKYSFTFRIYF